MPLFWGTHNKLERGEFRLDVIPGEIKEGALYPDNENILMHKGWLGILAHSWIAAGIMKVLEAKLGDPNVMISFNGRDYDNYQKNLASEDEE